MLKKNGFIVWPVYFDSTKPRKWRRVPRKLAVEKPTLSEIVEAVKREGFSFTVEENAKHPAYWYEVQGRVIVQANVKKSVLLKKIAENLQKIRAEQSSKRRR
ncbi:signal recognition particle subunit SRP19/SEC65 family protein [Thermofilum pendens]|uniref:Signal recognition particle 19 kDa protein n=1 Tax=Thermofilum pendens (strain DSM 2475 / Hrk 5) TaxID=368408 RepID=SRP19_THEPD|nr:signal recognition particle subunit SRP19/SEC65 family protein [Thermofilum pendens]A1RX38.1 RecName: Full=Signal recognition particle 19 kDa protein; Short=SRP19 [Thermofilum pendens Hrk 5]ABL77768.1 signal recognition particle, subunit SRP19 (srp19) [Thermofilum pendens Hrk 5]